MKCGEDMASSRKDIRICEKKFTITELNEYGFSVGVRKWRKPIDKDHFIIKTVHSAFDTNNFGVAHTPIVVDEIGDRKKFSKISHFFEGKGVRVLDCPIKFPGSSEYRIPKELGQFDEVIAKAVAFEHAINPHVVQQYYAYVTVDQGYVKANEYQRTPGCHVDGFQGARISPKRPINRSYIAYDRVPTVFYPQSFKTAHLDMRRHNFFESFDEQADPTAGVVYDRYSLLVMNSYTVHRSSSVEYPVFRTFFRLSFDVNMFDRYGNTHNPLFEYRWPMVTRDTQNHLYHKLLVNGNAF